MVTLTPTVHERGQASIGVFYQLNLIELGGFLWLLKKKHREAVVTA